METIVQKFGGTSLANEKNRKKVASKIIDKYEQGYKVVVVVSAIGRKGDPYATDTLLSLVDKKSVGLRDLDLLISCGEIISGVVLSNLLRKKGYTSSVLTGYQAGIRTDKNYGRAEVIDVDTKNIKKKLKNNQILIVTGFQGATNEGEITTLGRGGSDTSAVILGEALNCKYVEIYTDVDGIMTADPRIVSDARVIDSICYSELHQLAEDGAKVIHPKAVEIAARGNIEVKIKNTLNNCEGTIVKGNEYLIKNKNHIEGKDKKVINAITYKKSRVQVTVEMHDNNKNMNRLMSDITRNEISLDLINFFLDKKVFTIDKEDVERLQNILKDYDSRYYIKENCCKISTIGYKMHGKPGVMGRIVTALNNQNVDILQTSDSHTTIWCLINEKDLSKALNALHREFSLEKG